MNDIAILLLVFNRLEPVKQQFQVLRKLQPKRMYIASDGPRSSEELRVVNIVREYLLSSIDWECEIKTLFRDKNLGCKIAVDEAIKWFFSNEEKGIVLEDDVLPSNNFFSFCTEMLTKYEKEKRIGSITGRNELERHGVNDCFVASRFQCWGWASWSDRILDIDVDYGYDNDADYSPLFSGVSWETSCYLHSVLGLLQTNQVNSWAYAYDLNFKLRRQLQLYPKLNMVQNVGFGEAGTHSASRSYDPVKFFEEFLPKRCDKLPLVDDEVYIRNKLRSEYGGTFQLLIMRYVRYLGWLRKIKRIIRKIKIKSIV